MTKNKMIEPVVSPLRDLTRLNLTPQEAIFFDLAYNRFFDLYSEIDSSTFWKRDGLYRLHRLKDVFAVYAELSNHRAIKYILEQNEAGLRPSEQADCHRLLKAIRNLLSHFPLFESWDEIWFNKELITWEGEKGSINSLFSVVRPVPIVKYRFLDGSIQKLVYVSVSFPSNYAANEKIFLSEILTEREGSRFSIRLMLSVLIKNVENPNELLDELKSSGGRGKGSA